MKLYTFLLASILTLSQAPLQAVTLDEAKALYFNKQYEQAATALTSFIQANPADAHVAEAKYYQSMIPFRLGKWDEAFTGLKRFAAESTDTNLACDARYRAAIALYSKGDYNGCRNEITATLKVPGVPENLIPKLQHRLAYILFVQGKWDDARAAMNQIVSQFPASDIVPRAKYCAAACLFQKQDFEEYCKEVAELLKLPGLPDESVQEAKINLGLTLYQIEKWTDARSMLTQYVAQYPNSPQAHQAKSSAIFCLYNTEDYDGFQKEASELLSNPELPQEKRDELELYLATIPAKKGAWEGSMAGLKAFSEKHPNFADRLTFDFLYAQSVLKSASGLRADGKTSQAQELSAQGIRLIESYRSSVAQIIANEKDPNRIQQLEFLNVESYYYEENYPGLASAAGKLVGKHVVGTKPWAFCMIWQGIALAIQGQLNDAAKTLDAIVSLAGTDNNLTDHIPTKALYWRAWVACSQGDNNLVRHCMEKIRDQMPEGPVKRDAMQQFGWALALPKQ